MGAYVQTVQDFLKGKKTYLLAIVAIITALVAWSEGTLNITELITAIFVAFQTMFIRAGVSKSSLPAYNPNENKKVATDSRSLGPKR